jgi:hypothetical protein
MESPYSELLQVFEQRPSKFAPPVGFLPLAVQGAPVRSHLENTAQGRLFSPTTKLPVI